jgi:hypothetical protein
MHDIKPGKYKCTKCGKIKPASEFYVDGRKKNGISSWCKSCSMEMAKINREKRKMEQINALSKMHKMQTIKTDE